MAYEPEDTRMSGFEDTSKYTQTKGYEDARIGGYKQVHMNLKIRECEDARI